MSEERAGVPSASGVERLHLCPGSWNLERTLPDGERSDDADSGTRIHSAWETGNSAGLNLEELDTFEKIKELESEAIRIVFGELNVSSETYREQRLWLRDGHLKPRFSGKLDLYIIQDGVGLILDAKTGRNETEHATGNMQLRAQARLLDNHTNGTMDSITVGIIAPWQENKLTLCKYETQHLDAASDELDSILNEAALPNAGRFPSEKACRYCKAKAICPEARDAALSLPVANPDVMRQPEQIAAALTESELALCLDRGQLFERIHTAIRGEARKRLMAGDRVPGWHLKPGRVNRPITDPALVFGRFLEIGGTQEQFMTTVEVGKGALQERVNAITKETGKTLKNRMASILDGATQEKQSGAILERL